MSSTVTSHSIHMSGDSQLHTNELVITVAFILNAQSSLHTLIPRLQQEQSLIMAAGSQQDNSQPKMNKYMSVQMPSSLMVTVGVNFTENNGKTKSNTKRAGIYYLRRMRRESKKYNSGSRNTCIILCYSQYW